MSGAQTDRNLPPQSVFPLAYGPLRTRQMGRQVSNLACGIFEWCSSGGWRSAALVGLADDAYSVFSGSIRRGPAFRVL